MMRRNKTAASRVSPSQAASLHSKLQELEEALRAIHGGEAEALGVAETGGERIFTLGGAERAYRVMVEAMNEGAVTLADDGVILYANRAFAELAGAPLERVIGARIEDFALAMDAQKLKSLLALGQRMRRREEILLRGAGGLPVPALFSVHPLHEESADGPATLCAVVTNLGDVVASREARLRLAVIVESSDDAITAITRNGIITTWNAGAERLYGYAAGEAVGKPLSMLIPPERAHELAEFLACIERREAVTHLETVRLCKDGRRVDVSLTVSPIAGAAESGISASIIARDITEHKRAQKEISRLNTELEERVRQRTAQLEAVNRELEAFSYSVSHDLRGPLNAIRGFSGALAKEIGAGVVTERGRHYLARVQAAVVHMDELIDALLLLAQVSRVSLRWDQVDLSTMAETVLNGCRESEPGRVARWTIQPGLLAQGDRRLLRQVLDNLLGNAWKFSARQPQTCIAFRAERGPGGEVVYAVRDKGAGFDMAYSDKLFGAFQRLHAASEFTGTGVGLATVHRIITRHGGRIWAESKPGQGATFYFTLGKPPANP
ncbi:MAG: sensor histidine kinase [Ramlibacter sp.]